MNVLALDLGTKTGWALLEGGRITAGTWILGTPAEISSASKLRLDRRCDPRFLRLLHNLKCMTDLVKLDWVLFEDVQFSKGLMQAHLWASWRAAVWSLVDRENQIQIDCLATGKLKQFATGSGAADKDAMARALARDPRYKLDKGGVYDTLTRGRLDDNAIDAMHLLRWGIHILRPGITTAERMVNNQS